MCDIFTKPLGCNVSDWVVRFDGGDNAFSKKETSEIKFDLTDAAINEKKTCVCDTHKNIEIKKNKYHINYK